MDVDLVNLNDLAVVVLYYLVGVIQLFEARNNASANVLNFLVAPRLKEHDN